MSKNPTTITYDGKVIATFGAGQTAILKTKGDAVEHDIIVTAGSGTAGVRGISTSAEAQKSEIRYVSTQMGAITTTATVSVA